MQEMIHIMVRPFGPVTSIMGTEPIEYGLVPPVTLDGLTELLFAKYPKLADGAASLRFAVNEEYADADTELAEGDEVAIIPPVAGGSEPLVLLTDKPIDLDQLIGEVEHPSCGGIATFQGVVRSEGPRDRPLDALEYSAYESMALKQMRSLLEEAEKRFEIHAAAIVHRLGRLEVGEVSVAIVVSAPHRTDAFEACRWMIDALKLDVAIWKKEIWPDRAPTWVDPTKEDAL